MLIDTHAHLNDERLKPLIDEIESNMEDNNIESIINVGYDYQSSQDSVSYADKYDKIFAAVGIHPHDAKSATNKIYDYFIEKSVNPKVVAIGEIGLDYYYDYSPRDVQKRVLQEQIEVANSVGLPIIIHLRDAYQDMYDILKDTKSKLNNGLVLHCYSGSREMVQKFNEFDVYYAFGGAITFAKKKDIVVRAVPKDRLLLETDCPYMTPVPYRGKVNQPKYIQYVANTMAEFLDIDRQDIDELTTANAKRLFRRLI